MLTGWWFVAASVCVFVAVAALIHGAFNLIEHAATKFAWAERDPAVSNTPPQSRSSGAACDLARKAFGSD
jgi:hypothetical protein